MTRTTRFILCFFILCQSLSLPVQGQHLADPQKLSDPKSGSFILLGDPQGYTKYDVNQPLLDLTTAWIANNLERLNIHAVLCTGDLVEQNDNIVMNRKMLNQTSTEMWEAASNAFKRLDHKVPYIVSLGNHDYGYLHAENGKTNFPSYFPFERNSTWRKHLVANYPSREGKASMENAAFEFRLENWQPILIVTSEFYPRTEVLTWCKELIAKERYKKHRVIFMTHAYLTNGPKATLIDKNKYAITPGNTGKEIWEKLIQPSTNIDLVICGHTANGNGDFEQNVSYRTDPNAAGKNVHQMMFNVQTLGGGYEGNGGDGWLRILEFLPDGKTIKVRTYSPLFGISPSTRHLAHRTAPYDQFTIELN